MFIYPRWPHLQGGTLCLLVETNQGLLLVDTGLGLHDYEHPSRMMRDFKNVLRIPDNPNHTAVRQIARMGYRPEDIRHIVLTHLHLDHAGGLPDFPGAQVHVYRREYQALSRPRKVLELAYNKADFMHNPRWVIHDLQDGRWYDFNAIHITGLIPEVWLVPLTGHTSGHCGVAVGDGKGWVFDCGDALPVNLEFDFGPDWLYRMTIGPHVSRLKTFARVHPEVRMLSGHMRLEFFEKEANK
jgi:glyoxylase-like metal-dependent hydrolase (beta-lactamase superfamily II)